MANSPTKWSFDETYWRELIKRPNWYEEFVPFFRRTQESLSKDTKEADKFRKTARSFFEEQLEEGKVALAASGPNLDEQRQPIDTIVIHHTSAKPGYRLSYMNATQ